MDSLSNRYAEALILLAKEEGRLDDYILKARIMEDIFKNNKDFIRLLSNALISKKERYALIDNVFSSLELNTLINFVKVIIDNNRENELINIFEAFHHLCNQEKHIKEGVIYSTIQLDEKEIHSIEEKVSRKTNDQVELKNEIDPSLIGGIKVVINDTIIDASLKKQIDDIKKTLLESAVAINEN